MRPAAPATDPNPRLWCGGDHAASRFYEAMSLLAPEAERFFIRSIRARLPDVADAALAARCHALIAEEARHTRMHRTLNHGLAAHGLDVTAIVRPARRAADWALRRLPARACLALTAAGEHFAAILSDLFLAGGHGLHIHDPRVRAIYVHHARDEIQHSSVSFDLLRAERIGYAGRVLAMLCITLALPWLVGPVLWQLSTRGQSGSLTLAIRSLLRVHTGSLTGRLLRNYLRYFRPGFRPEAMAPSPG